MSEKTIGIIAGAGQFPLLLARAAKSRGLRVVAVALKGETAPELERLADETTWIRVGQVGKLINALRQGGAQQAAMCGAVNKTRMFVDVVPDLKAWGLIRKMRNLADDGILRTLAGVLEDEGIAVMASHELVPELLAPPGVLTKRGPSQEESDDIRFGWQVAAELGRLDIGQAVVVRHRAVVAVEAIEGTDACIRRAGKLTRKGAVVVKRCKPVQDRRFDLPAVGAGTVAAMVEAKAGCLVIEAGRTLVFDRKQMVFDADRAGLCIVALSDEQGQDET
jgi:DUF1009 family protein